MNHRMLLVPVLATIPVLASAQGTKLVNCRTLEAAGYFVGPDEVLDNDMVCQKVLAGAAEAKKLQPPKPLPGAMISNTEPTNVVEAAKASKELEKKAEAAREATAEKPAAAPDAETSAPVPSAQPTIPAPASVTPLKPEPAPVAPTPPPAAKPEMAFPPKPPAREVAGSPEPTHEPAPLPSAGEPALALAPGSVASAPAVSAQPVAAEGSIEKANAAPVEAAKEPVPESAASAPIVPATPAAAPTQVENTNSAPPEVALEPAPATVVPAPAVTPAPHEAGAAPAAAAPAPEKVNGFYDANAGNHVVTVAPAEGIKTSFAPGEPASALAAATPPAAAEAPAPVATAPPMTVPDYQDEERERVVKMGAFVKPQEGEPDPSALAHQTTFLPGDQDGFHEGQRPECSKNITLGSLKGEKLVLGTPAWAEKWIVKNQKRMPQVCFSDTPMQAARNYLIVFYTSPGAANGAELSNSVLTPAQGTPASGVGTFTLSYGSTWHYSYDRTVGITVLTRDEADEPHGQPGQAVYATAYTEEGVPVAEHWPPKAKKQVKADPKKPKQVRAAREVLEQVSSDLLGQLVDDVGKL
jgi:hypothetical protein